MGQGMGEIWAKMWAKNGRNMWDEWQRHGQRMGEIWVKFGAKNGRNMGDPQTMGKHWAKCCTKYYTYVGRSMGWIWPKVFLILWPYFEPQRMAILWSNFDGHRMVKEWVEYGPNFAQTMEVTWLIKYLGGNNMTKLCPKYVVWETTLWAYYGQTVNFKSHTMVKVWVEYGPKFVQTMEVTWLS